MSKDIPPPFGPEGAFAAAVRRVLPLDEAAMTEAAAHQLRLTKPAGSLGRLEDVAVLLAGIAGCSPAPVPEPAAVAVFAADHGVVDSGVTPWPREVTAQMVANFLAGGAAINVLARQVGASVTVVDVGVASELPAVPEVELLPSAPADDAAREGGPAQTDVCTPSTAAPPAPRFLDRKVRRGSADLSREPALHAEDVLRALDVGAAVAAELVDSGARLLVTGDMGIGNTTPSAAVIAALTGTPAAEVTGRGTGIDDEMLARKIAAVEAGLSRIPRGAGPITVLAEVGGLEICALAGFVVGGAAAGVPVIVDGVIALAGALAAERLCPGCTRRVFAGHRSTEPGASVALAELGLEPLLDLRMRLGEGTGACLAVPIVQAAARVAAEMATFDSAGVSRKEN
ncbi:MAG: hypothetical protein KatS3mg008_0310 [Acidimicrobiales bacterium]|nr:MAG: hypothetical protein KatS3mg008_0310 [Acidimicrobiales bacterium]